jgi:hypothetical protein
MQVLPKNRTPDSSPPATKQDGEIATAIFKFEHEFASFTMDSAVNYPDYYGFPGGNGGLTVGGEMTSRYGNMSLDTIRLQAIPQDKSKRIKRAFDWSENDDFLSAVCGVKEDFTIMGFDLRVRPEDGTLQLLSSRKSADKKEPPDDTGLPVDPLDWPELTKEESTRLQERSEFQMFLSLLSRKWDIESIVRDLIHDWFICDSMILYWRVDVAVKQGASAEIDTVEENSIEDLTPGITEIMALCPRDCEWDATGRPDRLFYRLPAQILSKIQAALNQHDKRVRQLAIEYLVNEENIPLRWIEEVSKGRTIVELRHDEGDYWIVVTKTRKHWGLADPTMKTIFPYLEIRKALREGDFATAYMMKHFIFHVTMGESIESGPLAGQRTNWATPQDTEKMYNVIIRTAKTARLVTNHTVGFAWIFPPKEMWDNAKYEKSEFAILNWSGLTMVLMTGAGATNSSGYISTKRLVATMIYARRRVRHAIQEFFDHSTVKTRLKVKPPKNMLVTMAFDENALKEPKQLLDELRFMTQEGMVDPPTAIKELGRDPDSQRASKLVSIQDNEQTGVWRPLNPQMGFGGGQFGNDGGRPPNPGTTQDEDTRNQPTVIK